MPAHVTHLLFAEDVLTAALPDEGKNLLSSFGPFIALGAQGPDMFYHNRRTMPSGLEFGKRLHRHGYGHAAAAMAECAVRLGGTGALRSPAGAFTLAFTTHAALDRITHPFIIYFSGWADPKKPDTARLSPCHAFFERIIDVLLLKRFRNADIREFDVFSRVDCGPEPGTDLTELWCAGIEGGIGPLPPFATERIRNAYADAMSFYRFTDPTNVEARAVARRLDPEDPRSTYRRALFHPYRVPEGIDFLNESGNEWLHPSFAEIRSRASFPELYARAFDAAVPAVRAVASVLRGGVPSAGLEAAVGNENLNDGRSLGRPAPSLFCDPLPLADLLESPYPD